MPCFFWDAPAVDRTLQNKSFPRHQRDQKWEFQDPKMGVLYHMFGHILGVYPLTKAWIHMVGTSNQSVPEISIEKWKVSTSTTIECPGMFKI